MARDRRSLFCTKKCADTYHNYKKVKIANSKLNGMEGNLKILQSLTCSKNSITINHHILESYGFDFEKSTEENTEGFIEFLEHRNIIVHLRKSKGKDIDAACGQLVNKLQ